MPTIHVDAQVMTELKNRAGRRTPNDLIRQLLNLPVKEELAPVPGVYSIPHGSKEFKDADKLRLWLAEELAVDGEYSVASSHYWRNVIPGSVCLFHKNKLFVGEGRMSGGLEPYTGGEASPETGRSYAGTVHFDPTSIKVYLNPVSFDAAERLLGKTLTFRGMQKLTEEDYAKLTKKVCK